MTTRSPSEAAPRDPSLRLKPATRRGEPLIPTLYRDLVGF